MLLQASLRTLQDFDPDVAHTLHKVLQSEGPNLAALLQLEGLSLDTSAEKYMQAAVQRICVEEVQWQSTGFAQVRITSFLACCCLFDGRPNWDHSSMMGRREYTCWFTDQLVGLVAVLRKQFGVPARAPDTELLTLVLPSFLHNSFLFFPPSLFHYVLFI